MAKDTDILDEGKILARMDRTKRLVQYKNKTDDELREIAIAGILKDSQDNIDTLGIDELFTNKSEREQAIKVMKRYLSEYQIETTADKMLLKELVNLEIIQNRLQKELNTTQEGSGAVSSKILDTLHKNLEQIVAIANKLGITKDKMDAIKSNGADALEMMKKKFAVWRANNQLSRTRVCPHCSKMIMFKIRSDKWEALKHPYIKDRLIMNETLCKLLGEGKISAKDYSEIIGTSEDYIAWMIEKLSNEDKDKYNLWRFIHKEIEKDSDASDNI